MWTLIFCAASLWADLTPPVPPQQLPPIRVEASAVGEDFSFAGFSESESRNLPLAVKSLDGHVRTTRASTSYEVAATDSYNAIGYWDQISLRGYTLDSSRNFLREGLPISAETAIPLENKETLELQKGVAGLQAGVATPGGLLNYVVKRPEPEPFVRGQSEVSETGNLLLHLDANGGAQPSSPWRYRLNAAAELLRPKVEHTQGSRQMLAAAVDRRLGSALLLRAEAEWSRRTQPSQAGQSLLGSQLPKISPRLNLNNQPWSQPVRFEGVTGTLKAEGHIGETWLWALSGGVQSLRTDDRMAYPSGCTSESLRDRFCSDGTFDVYDFRSENERRWNQALMLTAQGRWDWGDLQNRLQLGGWKRDTREHFSPRSYNLAGAGDITGERVVPEAPQPLSPSTDRDASDLDMWASDAASWKAWRAWVGLRYSSLQRASVRTDASRRTGYTDQFFLPWLGLGYDWSTFLIYLSASQGAESFVTPNKSSYAHRGEFLPAVLSRQLELGLRQTQDSYSWGLTLFRIRRPMVFDQAPIFQVDGEDVHQGLEIEGQARWRRFQVEGGAMQLTSRRQNAAIASGLNGKRAVNVPDSTLRLGLDYQVSTAPKFHVMARVTRDGARAVTADNSIAIPAWTRIDLGVSYGHGRTAWPLVWRLEVDNLFDTRAWRESPTQYGHIYLYALEERSVRLSVSFSGL